MRDVTHPDPSLETIRVGWVCGRHADFTLLYLLQVDPMDDVPSTDDLQDEMQQLAERYARMVPALHTLTRDGLLASQAKCAAPDMCEAQTTGCQLSGMWSWAGCLCLRPAI